MPLTERFSKTDRQACVASREKYATLLINPAILDMTAGNVLDLDLMCPECLAHCLFGHVPCLESGHEQFSSHKALNRFPV